MLKALFAVVARWGSHGRALPVSVRSAIELRLVATLLSRLRLCENLLFWKVVCLSANDGWRISAPVVPKAMELRRCLEELMSRLLASLTEARTESIDWCRLANLLRALYLWLRWSRSTLASVSSTSLTVKFREKPIEVLLNLRSPVTSESLIV